MSSADELIEDEQWAIYEFQETYIWLATFKRALDEATRDKEFLIRDRAVWQALRAMYGSLIIGLASWGKCTYSPGGLFGQLQSHHCKDFYIKKRPPREAKRLEFARINHTARRSAFEMRFPKAKCRGRVWPRDIEKLKDDFEGLMAPVVEDRHERAHLHEEEVVGSSLSVSELGKVLEEIIALFDDLRLICGNVTFGIPNDDPLARPDPTIVLLVDLTVLGRRVAFEQSIDDTEQMKEQRRLPHYARDDFYNELHHLHDSRAGEDYFNESELVEMALGKVVDSIVAQRVGA